MAVYSKQFLSGAAAGRPVVITGILPSTANTIHTAITGVTGAELDEVWLYGYVKAGVTTDRELTVMWGITTATGTGDDARRIPYVISWNGGLTPIIPGLPIREALTVKGYATAADVIGVVGYVNRVT